MREVLRAAATAAFVVGILLLMLNPPSLSGAEELLALLGGAAALIVVTAWATVRLIGDGMSEPEFERVVRRSEALARRPAPQREPTEFDLLVADAIDRLPPEIVDLLARGLTGPEIAEHLVVGLDTVRTHIRRAKAKSGARTLPHLIALWLQDRQ